MTKKLKTLPTFKTEQEEAAFWNTHDSTEYVDWDKAVSASFPNLQPTSQPITIRLPSALLQNIKKLANTLDVPYQSYIKILLADKVKEEQKKYYDTQSFPSLAGTLKDAPKHEYKADT